MKSVFIFMFVLIFFNVCERPPVQKDIPANHSSPDPGKIWRDKIESSPGAAEAPFELQFIDTMIAHNEQAIEMAQLVRTRAQHEELKTLARSIIAEAQDENAQLKTLRTKLFGETEPAINAGLLMQNGVIRIGTDLEKLDSLKENAFDLEFLRQMISHHENSVELANEAFFRDINAEIKSIAQLIVSTREITILQMKNRETSWSK